MTFRSLVLGASLLALPLCAAAKPADLTLNDLEYFSDDGVNVLVFSNWYDGLFSDAKISGVELIHHGERTGTNGDVRLHATPEQWDTLPRFIDRKVDRENQRVEARMEYEQYGFKYSIVAQRTRGGVELSVHTDQPLPAELVGKAGFNLEFLPASYFEKAFIMDSQTGIFPLYPTGLKESDKSEPGVLAKGRQLTLAPADDKRRVVISSDTELALYDGRSKAQNGWFVVRSLIPAERTGKVISWTFQPNSVQGWMRAPSIAHSQVGYHPQQRKVAVIELDANVKKFSKALLVKVDAQGKRQTVISAKPAQWGRYKRYNYLTFDFTQVREPGIYQLEYGNVQTAPFPIGEDVHAGIWHPTLDMYLPIQMDHVTVSEAYRIWHGASHLDDALQAPVNHEHFDLYAQGPTTDTRYKPGEHIPGLNIGGWFDAGDYDLRTQTHYETVMGLVDVWEHFQPLRDTTSVDYASKLVELHVPDQKPDLLQQIEHGTLQLLAQHRVFGRAIPGIVEAHLTQYTHLGDAQTKTDNLIYDPKLGANEIKGQYSGKFDDRWAFTSYSTPLNYGSIAALAAASRALKGYNDELARECLDTAIRAWNKEQSQKPVIFKHGNTTGGPLEVEEVGAAAQLLLATSDKKYAERILAYMPQIQQSFIPYAKSVLRILPQMDDDFRAKVRGMAEIFQKNHVEISRQNPFGTMITEQGWAGNGLIIHIANTGYLMHKAFPDVVDKEVVFTGLNYLLGTHPDSDISFVSGVGAKSKRVAYGMNRADFSFIPGGIVPGVLILKPDFPENKENWPFFWGQNEYVVNLAAGYIFLAHAVNELLAGETAGAAPAAR